MCLFALKYMKGMVLFILFFCSRSPNKKKKRIWLPFASGPWDMASRQRAGHISYRKRYAMSYSPIGEFL